MSYCRVVSLWIVSCALLAVADPVNIGAVTLWLGDGPNPGGFEGTGYGQNGALFKGPNGCDFDVKGNFYVADTVNHVVRRVAFGSDTTTTVVGQIGSAGDVEASVGTNARLASPFDVAFTTDGRFGYISDFAAHRIFKFDLTTTAVLRFVGNGLAGNLDDIGTAAALNGPAGIAVAKGPGDLYVAEKGAHRIRFVTSAGLTSIIAGQSGVSGDVDASTGTNALFNGPVGIALVQTTSVIYIGDSDNKKIRMISAAGVVSTVCGSKNFSGSADGIGTSAQFVQPWHIVLSKDAKYLYIADKGNNEIRRLTIFTGMVDTVVGSLLAGWTGTADSTAALLSAPSGVCTQYSTSYDRLYISGDNSIVYASHQHTRTRTQTLYTPVPPTPAPPTPEPPAPNTTIGDTTELPPSISAASPLAVSLGSLAAAALALVMLA